MKFPNLKKLKKEFAKKLVCKTVDYLAEHEDKGRWQPLKSDEQFIQLTTDFLWNRIVEEGEMILTVSDVNFYLTMALALLMLRNPNEESESKNMVRFVSWEICFTENRYPTIEELESLPWGKRIESWEFLDGSINDEWLDRLLLKFGVDFCDGITDKASRREIKEEINKAIGECQKQYIFDNWEEILDNLAKQQ